MGSLPNGLRLTIKGTDTGTLYEILGKTLNELERRNENLHLGTDRTTPDLTRLSITGNSGQAEWDSGRRQWLVSDWPSRRGEH